MKKIAFIVSVLILLSLGCAPASDQSAKQSKTPAEKTKPQKVVIVKNPEQFLKAIAPNRHIIIDFAQVDLDNASDLAVSEKIKNKFIYQKYHSALSIVDVDSLTIEYRKPADKPNAPEHAHFFTRSGYDAVITLDQCKNVTLKNIQAGHAEDISCTAPVLEIEKSRDIKIENCDLYGCGTTGIEFDESQNCKISKTTIRECKGEILSISSSKNILFSQCVFKHNEVGIGVFVIRPSGIKIENSKFYRNRISGNLFDFPEYDEKPDNATPPAMTVSKCSFEYNQADFFANQPAYETSIFDRCVVKDNSFQIIKYYLSREETRLECTSHKTLQPKYRNEAEFTYYISISCKSWADVARTVYGDNLTPSEEDRLVAAILKANPTVFRDRPIAYDVPIFCPSRNAIKKMKLPVPPATALPKQKVFRVKTAKEFLSALGSNRKIIIDADRLDLTKAKASYNGKFYSAIRRNALFHKYDMEEIEAFQNLDNLTIESADPEKTVTVISPEDRGAILFFLNCRNLTLRNLKLLNKYKNEAGSLALSSCRDTVIENCVLRKIKSNKKSELKTIFFAERCRNLKVKNCIFTTRSSDKIDMLTLKSVIKISQCNIVEFSGCQIIKTNAQECFQVFEALNIQVNDCTFSDSNFKTFASNMDYFFPNPIDYKVHFFLCDFKSVNVKETGWAKPGYSSFYNIELSSCKFSNCKEISSAGVRVSGGLFYDHKNCPLINQPGEFQIP